MRKVIHITLLILIGFIVYFNALSNPFISDDLSIVAHVKNPQWIWSHVLFLRPLLYFITYQIGGLNVFPYHLGNILFHLGSVILVYIILSRMTKKSIAFASSLLFCVHPLLTEAITWVSGGVYAQYSFFILLGLFFYTKKHEKRYVLYTTIAYLLALFSSEKAIIFPIILVFFELLLGNIKKHWATIVITGLLTILFGFLTLTRLSERVSILEQTSGLAPRWDNPITHIATATSMYLQLIFWPKNLTIYHSDPKMSMFELIIRICMFITFVFALFVTSKKHRLVRFWLSFFLITLLPVLSPYRITWIIAERYAYLSTAGICTVFTLILFSKSTETKGNILRWILVILVICLFGFRSTIRNRDWKTHEQFWKSTVRESPEEPKAHNTLAGIYMNQNKISLAIDQLEQAIILSPSYAPAYYNLGLIFEATKNRQKALYYYEQALKLNSVDPIIPEAVRRVKQDLSF